MKRLLLLALVLFSGCTAGVDTVSTGLSIYENFCGSKSYALLEEKGARLSALFSDQDVVLAMRDKITGSIVAVGSSGDYTYSYSPGEVTSDDYLIFIDQDAVDNKEDYCDYAVTVNKRTNDFVIINTTRMQLLD